MTARAKPLLMPLDRHARRFLDILAAGGGSAGGYADAGQRREGLRSLAAWVEGDPDAVGEIVDGVLPGPAGPMGWRAYGPAAARAAGMVFFHGGGWVAGGLDTHDGVCRRLANASGCRVVAIDYRLAPESPFPAAFDDAVAAVRWVRSHAEDLGIDASRLGVAGDSAGAGLAAAVAQAERGGTVAFQLLLCPILDVADEAASRRTFGHGYFLDAATLRRDLELYLSANGDRADPRVSPLRATDLTGAAPAFIHTAEFDPFRDEGEAYADRLAAAGVAVRLTRHAGMIHYFHAMPRVIPRARAATAEMGEEIRRFVADLA